MRARTLLATVAGLALLHIGSAMAQPTGYRLMVGVQAGATTDTTARLLAERMRISLNDSVVVENRPGAGQRVAMANF